MGPRNNDDDDDDDDVDEDDVAVGYQWAASLTRIPGGV